MQRYIPKTNDVLLMKNEMI